MKWILKNFNELSLDEFHEILELRIAIFVVEQDCPYPELDGKDAVAKHLMGIENGKLIAYTRIFGPGDYYKQAAFGRVAVHKEFRNQRIGYQLVEKVLAQIDSLFKKKSVKIGAQTYLKIFYESFGFIQKGAEYIEDGIPHIYMYRD